MATSSTIPYYIANPDASASVPGSSAPAETSGTGTSLNELLAKISTPTQAPPMVSKTQTLHPKEEKQAQGTQIQEKRPMSNQATSITAARRSNATSNLVNAITGAVATIKNKKIEQHKEVITKVMQSNENIQNAQTVVNDPNASPEDKKVAQGVLESNKKQMNDILSDPKHAKMLQKAFDVSYTDPEANNTPEIKAMMAAKQEVAKAGQYNAANPTEAKVAEMASKDKGAPNQQQPQQSQQGQNAQAQPKSQTPYADQFLKKAGTEGLNINPQYVQWQQQEQKKQQLLEQYVVPKLLTEQGLKDRNALTQEMATGRTKIQALQRDQASQRASNDRVAADKTRQRIAGMLVAAREREASLHWGAYLKVNGWDPKTGERITDAPVNQKLLNATIASATTNYSKLVGQRTALQSKIDLMKQNTKPDQAAISKAQSDLQYLDIQVKYANDALTQLNNKASTAGGSTNLSFGSNGLNGNPALTDLVGSFGKGTVSNARPIAAGADESDSPDDLGTLVQDGGDSYDPQ